MIPSAQSRLRTTSDRRWLPTAVLVWALAAVAAWTIFNKEQGSAPAEPSHSFVLRLHVDEECTLSPEALETVRRGLDQYGRQMWVEALIVKEHELDPFEVELLEELRTLPRTQIERIGKEVRRREPGARCWQRIGT